MSVWRRRVFASVAALVVLVAAGALWHWTRREPDRRLEPGWPATVITLAANIRFADPFGIAAAPDGTIYIADGVGAHRIYRFTDAAGMTLVAGSDEGFTDGPALSARFSAPSGIALDGAGNVYVADTGNDAIRRISPDGLVSTIASPAAGLAGPVGIAVDSRGRLIVADTYNDRIAAVSPDGTVTTIAGGTGPGFDDGTAPRFHTPCGVAVDAAGNIYVADTGNDALRVIAPSGTVSTIASGADVLFRPLASAVTADGSVFATDARGRIVEISRRGDHRIVAGSRRGFADGSGPDALFRAPSGIAATGPGRLLVTDRRNDVIRIVAAPSRLELRPPAPPVHPQFDSYAFAHPPLLWPFTPIEGPFEITGTLGEPRGGEGSERFHAGLDVHAPEGTAVHVVRDAAVDDPVSANDFGSLVESVRIGPVAYVHLRVGRDVRDAALDDDRFVFSRNEAGAVTTVRVKRGARFRTGDVIGTVNRFYHAHLNVGWPGEELNPLLFTFPGFADSVPPTIARIRVTTENGEPVPARKGQRLVLPGRVRIVVDAWDQVDGNERRRRLGLYRLGYQILDAAGSPFSGFEQPLETIRFDRQPLDAAAARIIYASGSGIPVYGNRSTRFLYVVTSTLHDGVATDAVLDTAGWPPGNYTLRILAADIAGNVATRNRDLSVTVPRAAE